MYETCKKLRGLKHKGTVRNYVKEFTIIVLQIPSMLNDVLLFYFSDRCATWVRQELQCCGVNNVDEAIKVVESLMKFQGGRETQAKNFKPTKGNFGKGCNERQPTEKPNWRPNPKVEYIPNGNKQTSW